MIQIPEQIQILQTLLTTIKFSPTADIRSAHGTKLLLGKNHFSTTLTSAKRLLHGNMSRKSQKICKARNWCITTFHDEKPVSLNDIQYSIHRNEIAPDTGNPHTHWYIQFKKIYTSTMVTTLFGTVGIHLEPAKGKLEDQKIYLSKPDEAAQPYVEYGTPKVQGKRSDLESLAQTIVEGTSTVTEIAHSHPKEFIRYHRGLRALEFEVQRSKFSTTRRLDLETIVYWGDTGTGKTRAVLDEHGESNVFILNRGCNAVIWWDGYNQEKVLLIDDFYGWIKLSMLLKILDIYPLRLEIKGSFTWAAWTKIYITSNKPPDEWYNKSDQMDERVMAAFKRRIHQVKEFKELRVPRRQNGKRARSPHQFLEEEKEL